VPTGGETVGVEDEYELVVLTTVTRVSGDKAKVAVAWSEERVKVVSLLRWVEARAEVAVREAGK
jgi:hypothetical protein